ncbi:hypothetical protein RUM43_003167 [Polyplax serrata]|uniref:F-box domain-containing protein n=1 Tax=Polyplax serrata TaxID=468196 RepID=A0AAN8P2Z8_POLSC
MDFLPDEIILHILELSSGYDLTTSFQFVSTRWNYLINRSDTIWRGDVKQKGLTEQMCKENLCEVLKRTPKLKYLQIGGICRSQEYKEESLNRTEDILQTIRVYNRELEYLHVIDRFPLTPTLLQGTKLKHLRLTISKLSNRRSKINELKRIFGYFPDVDNFWIDFYQRLQFNCQKNISGWKISLEVQLDAENDFM